MNSRFPTSGRQAATPLEDADARAVSRASRAVGLQITIASSVLVLAVVIAAFAFVFTRASPASLFDPVHPHETKIDVGGVDILFAALTIGLIAVVLAGTMSWFATRRAVRPLGDALRIQRTFVSDASHELRTPLAVLDARLQLLQRGLLPDDPSRPIVTDLRRDTRTLIDIVNDLLSTAEPDEGSAGPVPVIPVVRAAVDSIQMLALAKKVAVLVATPNDGSTADPRPSAVATLIPEISLHRCIVALLDNALAFSPAESTITVSISTHHSHVRISVRDEGSGITGIDPGRIFDRFARSSVTTESEVRSRTGFGIGLALVRATVERVGGTAAVASSTPRGTEIELVIPLARER